MKKGIDYESKPKDYYANIRSEMVQYLPENSKRILDIGCGTGAFANYLQETKGVEAWGIEFMPEEAEEAKKVLVIYGERVNILNPNQKPSFF